MSLMTTQTTLAQMLVMLMMMSMDDDGDVDAESSWCDHDAKLTTMATQRSSKTAATLRYIVSSIKKPHRWRNFNIWPLGSIIHRLRSLKIISGTWLLYGGTSDSLIINSIAARQFFALSDTSVCNRLTTDFQQWVTRLAPFHARHIILVML